MHAEAPPAPSRPPAAAGRDVPPHGVDIAPLVSADHPDWLRLRLSLWPDTDAAEHRAEMGGLVAEPGRYGQFIATSASGTALGFAEVSLRTDYVNGTDSSPVAFLEGLYVEPFARHRGVARALVQAACQWARSAGCSEIASDTPLDNLTSQAVHARLGFAETERVVYFRRSLDDRGPDDPPPHGMR